MTWYNPILDTTCIHPNSLLRERTGNCITIIHINTKTSSIAIEIKNYYLTLLFLFQQVFVELYHLCQPIFQVYLYQLLIYFKKTISLSTCQSHSDNKSNIWSIGSYMVLCSRTMTPLRQNKEGCDQDDNMLKSVCSARDSGWIMLVDWD